MCARYIVTDFLDTDETFLGLPVPMMPLGTSLLFEGSLQPTNHYTYTYTYTYDTS